MELIRKISKNYQVYLGSQLKNMDLKPGDRVIVKDDEGKHGLFISIFTPTQERHLKMAGENEKTQNG